VTGIDDPTTALPGAVSARVPDWSREAKRLRDWQPSRSLMASIRSYQRLRGGARPDRAARRWLAVLRHRFWSVVTGADVPLVCRIEGGLLLPHPNGIVIHPDARIGPNCLLFQQVTLGTGGPVPGAPVLAGHVDVGAGAKILGGVHIGAHAVIGANAVVLCGVPDGATAVGIPARIVPSRRPGDSDASEARHE
jgi:serine O-acetyltransferase